MKLLVRNLILVILVFISTNTYSQKTIKGFVSDKITNEALAYVTIYVPMSNIGSTTDDNGYFFITINEDIDSLIFSYLGYQNVVLRAKQLKSDSISVLMEPEGYNISEVVIKASRKTKKDTLAHIIYHNVVDHKDNNREKNFKTTQYEEYAKTVLSLYNINANIKDKKIFKPFRFVLSNQDSTDEGKMYIPLILKETVTQNYNQKNPDKNKILVKASNVSGIEQLRFSELLDVQFEEFDAYANQQIMNSKAFQMPFADGALLNYKYFVLDSNLNDKGETRYQLGFVPRAKGDLTYVGKAWIHAPTWAIESIELSIDKRANINYLNDFHLTQSFEQIDGNWIKIKETRSTNLAFTKRKRSKSIRFYKYISRKDVLVNQPINDTIFKGENFEYIKDYRKHSEVYWNEKRHDSLTFTENKVYFLIDSLKKTHTYKVFSGLGRFITSGYYRAGPIDIGSLHQCISWNNLEGARFRLQVRSNGELSKYFGFKAYVAYGTKDKRIKYGADVFTNLPDRHKRGHKIGFSYKDDYQRFSLERGAFEYDYIHYSLLRRGPITDFVYIKNADLYYQKQVLKDLSADIHLDYKKYKTLPGLIEFYKTQADSTRLYYNSFNVFTPSISLFYSPKAKFMNALGKQFLVRRSLPRFTLTYSFSKKGLLKSEFNYHKLDFTVKQTIPFVLGRTRYMLSATKLFGNVPYPLVVLHPGNQSFILDEYRFSLMKEGQYAGDEQISLFFEHHFEGFFFNKIPYFNKLQLREVFVTKLALSRLHPDKIAFSDLPPGIQSINGFYAEMGFGIDNIGKLLRIDFLWRLTQKNDPLNKNFRVQFAVSPNF